MWCRRRREEGTLRKRGHRVADRRLNFRKDRPGRGSATSRLRALSFRCGKPQQPLASGGGGGGECPHSQIRKMNIKHEKTRAPGGTGESALLKLCPTRATHSPPSFRHGSTPRGLPQDSDSSSKYRGRRAVSQMMSRAVHRVTAAASRSLLPAARGLASPSASPPSSSAAATGPKASSAAAGAAAEGAPGSAPAAAGAATERGGGRGRSKLSGALLLLPTAFTAGLGYWQVRPRPRFLFAASPLHPRSMPHWGYPPPPPLPPDCLAPQPVRRRECQSGVVLGVPFPTPPHLAALR